MRGDKNKNIAGKDIYLFSNAKMCASSVRTLFPIRIETDGAAGSGTSKGAEIKATNHGVGSEAH